jgi:hypothetical protein
MLSLPSTSSTQAGTPMNSFMCVPSFLNAAAFPLVFFCYSYMVPYGMHQPPTPDDNDKRKVTSISQSVEINGGVEGEMRKQGERTEHAFIFSVLW